MVGPPLLLSTTTCNPRRLATFAAIISILSRNPSRTSFCFSWTSRFNSEAFCWYSCMRRRNCSSRSRFAAGLRTEDCLTKSSSILRNSFSSNSISACRFFEKAVKFSLAFLPALVSLSRRCELITPIFASILPAPPTHPLRTSMMVTAADSTAHSINSADDFHRFPFQRTTPRLRLKQGPDRKFEHAHSLAGSVIKVDPIGDTQRTKWRYPAPFDTDRAPQIERQWFIVVKTLSVVEKEHTVQLRLGGDRKDQLVVEDQLLGRAEWSMGRGDGGTGSAKGKPAHGIDAAHEKPFIQWNLRPAECSDLAETRP